MVICTCTIPGKILIDFVAALFLFDGFHSGEFSLVKLIFELNKRNRSSEICLEIFHLMTKITAQLGTFVFVTVTGRSLHLSYCVVVTIAGMSLGLKVGGPSGPMKANLR